MSAPAGLLQFGDSHDSILGQSSMLTAASVTSFGTGSLVEAGATVDSILGIKAGSVGACMFTGFSAAQLIALDKGGQFSFDVETEALSETNTATASVGPEVADNTYLVTHSVTDGGGVYGRTWISTDNRINSELNTADTHVSIAAHSLGNGAYSRITYSWTYGKLSVYINGRLHGESNRTVHTADIFKFIYLGSLRGGNSTGSQLTLQSHYIRNFLISAQPAMIPKHEQLKNVYMFGDSIVAQAALSGSVGYYRNNAQDVIKAYLAKRGFHINLTVDGHGGATINDSSGTTLESFRAAMMANDPDMVIIQSSTNDATEASLNANFLTDLNDHIDTILAGTCKKIILGNTPSVKYNSTYNTAQYVANVAAANAILNDASNRWDAENPTDTGRVAVYDFFGVTGGENPIADVFSGQVGTSRDNDYHPSAKGQLVFGETIAKAIINNLS